MSRLLLVDFKNLAWLVRFSNWKQPGDLPHDPAPWRSAIARRLRGLFRDFAAERAVLFFDAPPYFRNKFYPPYKTNRSDDLAWVDEVWRQVREATISAAGPMAFSLASYEADDLIARSCLAHAETSPHQLVICSSDKDLRQLVDRWDNVVYWSLIKARWVNAEKRYDSRWFHALLGDDSDGVPGVTGPIMAEKFMLEMSQEERREFLARPYKPKKADERHLEANLIPRLPATNREVFERNLRLFSLVGRYCLADYCPVPVLPRSIDAERFCQKLAGDPAWSSRDRATRDDDRDDRDEREEEKPAYTLRKGMPKGYAASAQV